MKTKKMIISALSISLLSTGLFTTGASAETSNPLPNQNIHIMNPSINPTVQKDIEGISKYFDLDEAQTQKLITAAINKDDTAFETRGKLSWAAKAIKQLWKELPPQVKERLGNQGALIVIANRVEHFTGAIEDAVYSGVLDVVGNSTTAWWITKALMLLL
ncbi:hypothetical protein [Bacillus sp. FSL R12-0069]|uniref:hypothetical protein n=1 Tax=Bacillus sp. FSL R12-0069 TaxID=2975342 RepID=UPI0030F8BCB4